MTGRSNILRREHDNQGVESLILSQISWKRIGGPGVVVEVVEGLCRPTETRITPFRGKGGMLDSIGKLQHEWRAGSPAWCAEVLESVVQANKSKNFRNTQKGRDVELEW